MAITISKPTVGGSQDSWGTTLNTALDDIVAALNGTAGTVAPDMTSFDINGTAVTATADELNILDGVTATTDELNLLDGVTATTAELNYVDGVTSAIQTQLDALNTGKQSVDATLTALAGLATGANKIPYSTGTDTFSQLSFVDEDNMASNSASALPSQQSVKAYVDTQVSSNALTTFGAGFPNKARDGGGTNVSLSTLNGLSGGSNGTFAYLGFNSNVSTNHSFSYTIPSGGYQIAISSGEYSTGTLSGDEDPDLHVGGCVIFIPAGTSLTASGANTYLNYSYWNL